MRKYSVAGILSEIVDLKYLYIEPNCTVYYDSNLAPTASFVQNLTTTNIVKYSESSDVNKFGGRFKYSKFQKVIDQSHESVMSNITNIEIRRDINTQLNTFAEYELCFGNRFYIRNHGHGANFNGNLVGYNIKSSGFTVSGISGTVYLGDSPVGNLSKGTVFLFKLKSSSEPYIVRQNVGTIDYNKGEIKLNPINIISTLVNRGTPLIEVSACPYSNDVIGLQDLYLQLDVNNTVVNVVADNISSGNDVSGTNYIVSSSYGSNILVRGQSVFENEVGPMSTPTTPSNTITLAGRSTTISRSPRSSSSSSY
jgi:hypothetical protein